MSRPQNDAGPGTGEHPEAEKQNPSPRNLLDSDDPRQPICIRRGANVEIRLRLREHRGREFIDVRSFFANDDGEWLPSRRGVTIPPALWGSFFDAVVELDRRLRTDRLVADTEADVNGDRS